MRASQTVEWGGILLGRWWVALLKLDGSVLRRVFRIWVKEAKLGRLRVFEPVVVSRANLGRNNRDEVALAVVSVLVGKPSCSWEHPIPQDLGRTHPCKAGVP